MLDNTPHAGLAPVVRREEAHRPGRGSGRWAPRRPRRRAAAPDPPPPALAADAGRRARAAAELGARDEELRAAEGAAHLDLPLLVHNKRIGLRRGGGRATPTPVPPLLAVGNQQTFKD